LEDNVYYLLRMCVMTIIRISQYTFHEFCATVLPRLVLKETVSSTSLHIDKLTAPAPQNLESSR